MPRRTLKIEKGLVPVEKFVEGAPAVNLDKVPPSTYYRKRNDTTFVFTTIMPDGLYVGWDNCARCKSFAQRCTCDRGVEAPPSIWHIYGKREERIDAGMAVRVTNVDTKTVKPSGLPPAEKRQGQDSAPRVRVKAKPMVEQPPKPPRKRLKRRVKP